MTRNGEVPILVDNLGTVKAQIAKLQKLETRLVNRLKDKGLGVYEGSLFQANVFSQGRTDVDWEAVAREVAMIIPPRILLKHTKSTSIVVCKVTARRKHESGSSNR